MLFTCEGGRPTNGLVRQDARLPRGGFPYFNIDWQGQGAIVALGWPGQWAAELTRGSGNALRWQAGMSSIGGQALSPGDRITDTDLTSVILAPGEEIRTPRVLIQFWNGGDWIDAQNSWRQWFIAHNMPRVNGKHRRR